MTERLDTTLDLTAEYEFACKLAREAATIVTTFYVGSSEVEYKSHDEPVTEADRSANQHIVTRISEMYPDDGILSEESKDDLIRLVENSGRKDRLRLMLIETPANPTNELFDLRMCREVADHFSNEGERVLVTVDNTYMGPLWQHPLHHGADLVMYSATKYIGGHSDVIAGAVLGSRALITRVKTLRTFLGNMAGPWTGWLLLRSLETLKVRMEQQAENARVVADFLVQHPKVDKVHYLGLIPENTPQYTIFKQQCSSAGAMVSFHIKGGEAEAFRFLNHLKMIKLAVSLGSTESLAEHPATMTHAGLTPEHQREIGITANLVRISVGVENHRDLVYVIGQALEKV